MKLIDSHAHLDFEDFHGEFDSILDRAASVGVEKIINIGADLSRSQASIYLAENHSNIFATVGVHPEDAEEIDLDNFHQQLWEMAKSSRRVVGIGECGLDYNFYEPRDEVEKIKEKQKKLFQLHIDIARHLALPLVIHIRNGNNEEAVNEVYEIIKNSDYHRGVIHCFSLGLDWAKRFIDLGFYIGFTGIITYKNAENIREAAKNIPLDKILIETDCPFLAPQKYRGKRNEPAYVIEIADKIAEIRGLTLENVAQQTTMNSETLFGI